MDRTPNSCRELQRSARSAAASRRRAKNGRDSSGSVANGGIVIRPQHTKPLELGQPLQERVQLTEPHPALRRVIGDVDLDEDSLRPLGAALDLLGGGIGLQGVDQLDAVDHVAGLPALQVTDEVPGERPAVERLLGQERVRLVLADSADAGLR